MNKYIFPFYLAFMFSLFIFSSSVYAEEIINNKIPQSITNENIDIKIQDFSKELSSQKIEIDKNNAEFEDYKESLNNQINLQNGNISNSFSSISNLLNVWSVVFGLFGIILGIFVNYLSNRTKNNLEESKVILEKVEKMKDEIANHSDELYKKLYDKETANLIKRLKNTPEDIDNIFSLLAIREIDCKFYKELKTATLEVFNNPDVRHEKTEGIKLLFQHFPRESFFDNELVEIILKHISIFHNASFKKEKLDAIQEIITFAENSCFEKNLNNIIEFCISFESIQNNEIFFNKIYESVKNKNNKLLLYKSIKEKNKSPNLLKKLEERLDKDHFNISNEYK